MFRATAICALGLGVAITAVLWRHELSRHDTGVQSLPAPPLLHQAGPSVLIPDSKPSKPLPVSRGHQTGGKAQIVLPSVGSSHSVGPDSTPTGHANPPTVRPTPHKPKKPPKVVPAPPTPTSPPPAPTTVTTPGPTASADPTREPASSPPPATTPPTTTTTPPTSPPTTPPPPTPPPVDSRPGNGYGDANHEHTGPPGQSKDGSGHDNSNGNGNHGDSNKHGG